MTPRSTAPAEADDRAAVALAGAQSQGGKRIRLGVRSGRRDYVMRRLLAAADAIAIAFGLAVGALVDPDPGLNGGLFLWGLISIPMWIVLFKAYGLYDRDLKRISHSTVDDIPRLFHALVIGTLLMWAVFRVLPPGQFPLAAILGFGGSGMVAVLALRSFVRSLSVTLLGAERVLMVGNDRMTEILVRKMRAHREYGLEPIGVIMSDGGRSPVGLPLLDESDGIAALAGQYQVDRLVVSHTDVGEQRVLEVLRECKELMIKVSLLPELFDAIGPSVEIDDVEGVTVLGINPPVLGRSSRAMKRCLDLVGALLLSVVLLPVIALIAIVVKLNSRGPVFFRQERVGKEGEPFPLLKFRTMHRDAEARRAELLSKSIDPNWLHLEHDPRITRVGRVLRMSSLDELPQLWNVIKGEMSLVGPRPLIESEDRQIDGWGRRRLHLTPGITGVWQVLGRTNIPFEEMVKLDYLYVTNWSLWTDVRLILRTLPAVLRQRGAN
jgi:exopolysaccharide biosynthesis polyprenyl glycosylphosphotransferase